MESNNKLYQNLLDNMFEGVYFVDPKRKILYWNKGAERLTGYKATEMIGAFCWDNKLMHVNNQGINLCKNGCPLSRTLIDGRTRKDDVFLHHKDGHRVPVLINISPIRDGKNQIIGAVELFRDNSPQIKSLKAIEELRQLVLIDPLTNIGNRRYAEINLKTKFYESHRYNWKFGLVFVDIDDFKKINDEYGHKIGDRALRMVANTLSNSVRQSDIISRYGGEEFIATISNVNEDQLLKVANKLRLLVEKSSFTVGRKTVRVTISIGATMALKKDSPSKLLRRADKLMYQSKKAGRNRVTLG